MTGAISEDCTCSISNSIWGIQFVKNHKWIANLQTEFGKGCARIHNHVEIFYWIPSCGNVTSLLANLFVSTNYLCYPGSWSMSRLFILTTSLLHLQRVVWSMQCCGEWTAGSIIPEYSVSIGLWFVFPHLIQTGNWIDPSRVVLILFRGRVWKDVRPLHPNVDAICHSIFRNHRE